MTEKTSAAEQAQLFGCTASKPRPPRLHMPSMCHAVLLRPPATSVPVSITCHQLLQFLALSGESTVRNTSTLPISPPGSSGNLASCHMKGDAPGSGLINQRAGVLNRRPPITLYCHNLFAVLHVAKSRLEELHQEAGLCLGYPALRLKFRQDRTCAYNT